MPTDRQIAENLLKRSDELQYGCKDSGDWEPLNEAHRQFDVAQSSLLEIIAWIRYTVTSRDDATEWYNLLQRMWDDVSTRTSEDGTPVEARRLFVGLTQFIKT